MKTTMVTEVKSVRTSEMMGEMVICDDGSRYLVSKAAYHDSDLDQIVDAKPIAAPYGRSELHDAWLSGDVVKIPVRALYKHCPIERANG